MFAGTMSTASTADFVCRVTSLANVDCPQVSQWARVGLISCGDLSDVAPAVTLDATGANGVYQQAQTTPIAGWSAKGPASTTAPSGLIGGQVLTLPLTQKAANYLLHPVWLRLHREGLDWYTYTSLDGKA